MHAKYYNKLDVCLTENLESGLLSILRYESEITIRPLASKGKLWLSNSQ